MSGLVLGIDASNLRDGGGRTHLIELLAHAGAHLGEFGRVKVWGGTTTLAMLPRRPWLDPVSAPHLDGSLAHRTMWQLTQLPALARQVDLVFAPGGLQSPFVRPTVVMCRNMIMFDRGTSSLYRGLDRLQLELLRWAQIRSFIAADAVIFLTEYARSEVLGQLPRTPRRWITIPHGVSERFRAQVHAMRSDPHRSFSLLYVSTIAPYKNQLALVEAVARLRAERDVTLTLIGAPHHVGDAHERLRTRTAQLDPEGRFIRVLGPVPFAAVHEHYRTCDAFVFPSSCENMPNILLEAMASGLPIACSDRGPMPEVLGDAGVYFDPDDCESIVAALRRLADDHALRRVLAARALGRAAAYSWERCARETFAFLSEVALGGRAEQRRR